MQKAFEWHWKFSKNCHWIHFKFYVCLNRKYPAMKKGKLYCNYFKKIHIQHLFLYVYLEYILSLYPRICLYHQISERYLSTHISNSFRSSLFSIHFDFLAKQRNTYFMWDWKISYIKKSFILEKALHPSVLNVNSDIFSHSNSETMYHRVTIS